MQQPQQAPQEDYFAQKRIEVMIDMANKKVFAEMQQLKQTIQRLENDVAELRKRTSGASFSSQPGMQPAQQQTQRPTGSSTQMSFSPEKKVSADVPRYGHYTSDDVSVEKFFNFGSGRKR